MERSLQSNRVGLLVEFSVAENRADYDRLRSNNKRLRYLAKPLIAAALLFSHTEIAVADEPEPVAAQVAPTPIGNEKQPTRQSVPEFPDVVVNYANDDSAYSIGNMVEGDIFVSSGHAEKAAKGIYELGWIIHKGHESDSECGWVKKIELPKIKVNYKKGVCMDKARHIKDFEDIGKDPNCDPHECSDGSRETKIKERCRSNELTLNYNQKRGKAYDKLPFFRIDDFLYRYTTLDGKKAKGRAILEVPQKNSVEIKEVSVWAYLPRKCVIGHPRGGTKLDPNHG
jgi:hypothetical protein